MKTYPNYSAGPEELRLVYHHNIECDLEHANFERLGRRLNLTEEQLEGVQGHSLHGSFISHSHGKKRRGIETDLGDKAAEPEADEAALTEERLLALDGRDDEVSKDPLERRVLLERLVRPMSAAS